MKGSRIEPETSVLPPPTRCYSTVTWQSTWTINSAARVTAATDDVIKKDVSGFSRRDSRLLTLKSVVVIALPLLSLTVLLCLSVADGVTEWDISERRYCTRAAVAKVTIVFALMLERKMAARYLQHASAEQRQRYGNTVNLTARLTADDGCDRNKTAGTERILVHERQQVFEQNVTSSATWTLYSDIISSELLESGDAISSACRLEPSCVSVTSLRQFLVFINVFEHDELFNLFENMTVVRSHNVSVLLQYNQLFYPASNADFVTSAEYEASHKMWEAYKRVQGCIAQPQQNTSSLGSDIKVILESIYRQQLWLFRVNLIIIFTLSAFIASPYLYFLVRFANRLHHIPHKVRTCFEIVDRKSAELEVGRQRSDALLQQMLPKKVIAELKRGRVIEAEKFDEVTIYFSDIVGFNEVALEASPIIVVDLLNCIYSAFDECIEQYDVYKVETIGDSYLVASGLPQRNGARHVAEICSMALNMVDVAREYSLPGSIDPLPIRIGINTGPIVTAVIGLKNPRYCLFGDTINTASRMQSTGQTFKIQTTEAVRNAADKFGNYEFEIRGNMTIKGKGTMRTFWLKSKSNKRLMTNATFANVVAAEPST